MKFAIVLSLCFMMLGCTTYYQVKDPSTGSMYYSTKIEEERGGAVSLKDARTNAQVTIQNSEVMEVEKSVYEAGVAAGAEAAEAEEAAENAAKQAAEAEAAAKAVEDAAAEAAQ